MNTTDYCERIRPWKFPYSTSEEFFDCWREIPFRYINYPADDKTADEEIILAVAAVKETDPLCGGAGILYFPTSKIGRCYQMNFYHDLGVDCKDQNTLKMLNLLFCFCLFKQTLVNRKKLKLILFDNDNTLQHTYNEYTLDQTDILAQCITKIIEYLQSIGTVITNDKYNRFQFNTKNFGVDGGLHAASGLLAWGWKIPELELAREYFDDTHFFYNVPQKLFKKHRHLFSNDVTAENRTSETLNLENISQSDRKSIFEFTPEASQLQTSPDSQNWKFPCSEGEFLERWKTETPYWKLEHFDNHEIVLAVHASGKNDPKCGGAGVLYNPNPRGGRGRCYQMHFLSDLDVKLDLDDPSEIEMFNLLFALCFFKYHLKGCKNLRIICDNNEKIRSVKKGQHQLLLLSIRKIIDDLKKSGTVITNDPSSMYDVRSVGELDQVLRGVADRLSKGFLIPMFKDDYYCLRFDNFQIHDMELFKKFKYLFSNVDSALECAAESIQLQTPPPDSQKWTFPFTAEEFLERWKTIPCQEKEYFCTKEIVLAVDASGKIAPKCGGAGVLYYPVGKFGDCYRMHFMNDLDVPLDLENSSEIEMFNLLFALCFFKHRLVNRKYLRIICDNEKIRRAKKGEELVLSIRKIIEHLKERGTVIINDPNNLYEFRPVSAFDKTLHGVADRLSKGLLIPTFKDDYRCLAGNDFKLLDQELVRKVKTLFSNDDSSEESSDDEQPSTSRSKMQYRYR